MRLPLATRDGAWPYNLSSGINPDYSDGAWSRTIRLLKVGRNLYLRPHTRLGGPTRGGIR